MKSQLTVVLVWWECGVGVAIMKLMPSIQHEFSASQFFTNLTDKVLQITRLCKSQVMVNSPLVRLGRLFFQLVIA